MKTWTEVRGYIPFRMRQRAKNCLPFLRLHREGKDFLTPLEREKCFIFIHIPKTAGTSLSHAWFGEEVLHRPLSELERFDYWQVRRSMIIAVIRNPVDRFLSAFNFLERGGINEWDNDFSNKVIHRHHGDINEFIQQYLLPFSNQSQDSLYVHFRPQQWFLTTRNGGVRSDLLIPFERLIEGYSWVTTRLNLTFYPLPKHNVTKQVGFSRNDLSPTSDAILKDFYRSDEALYQQSIQSLNELIPAKK